MVWFLPHCPLLASSVGSRSIGFAGDGSLPGRVTVPRQLQACRVSRVRQSDELSEHPPLGPGPLHTENSPLKIPAANIGWNSAPNSTLISCGLYDSRLEDNLLKTRCDSVGGRQGKNTAVPSPHLMMRSTLRMRGWTRAPAASMGISEIITP